MPFWPRQPISAPSPLDIGHYEDIVDDKGFVQRKFVKDASPLAPTDLFKLSNLQKAGVDLRQVKTRVCGGSAAVADAIDFISNFKE